MTLLYEEARYNILEGRYPCEMSHYLMLGGIQARIELGPYKPEEHTTQYFRYFFFPDLCRILCNLYFLTKTKTKFQQGTQR